MKYLYNWVCKENCFRSWIFQDASIWDVFSRQLVQNTLARVSFSFKIATVTFKSATISTAILSCISHPKICMEASTPLFFIFVIICSPTMATSKSFSSVGSNIWNALPSRPSQLFRFLEELSNIIYSCLLTLTVVQNLVWSNQLNISHFMIQRQLLSLHSPEISCHPSKGVNLVLLTYIVPLVSNPILSNPHLSTPL